MNSNGWTIIRNQQGNKTSSNNEGRSEYTTTASSFLSAETEKGGSSVPFPTAALIPELVASTSIWSSLSLGEEDGEVDMIAMLEARDAALNLKKTQSPQAIQSSSTKLAVAVRSTRTAELIGNELHSQFLLSQALRCWKVEAVTDPCPHSTEMLINAAMGGGDDDDEDDPFHIVESESAIQHIQQMLAGYVAESELEGEGDDQGGDNPVLLELLKKEMTAHENKQKQKLDHSYKQKADTISRGKSLSSSKIGSSTSKAESTSDNRTERDDDSMLNKSDIRSRVERAFYATISHAPSQVMTNFFPKVVKICISVLISL